MFVLVSWGRPRPSPDNRNTVLGYPQPPLPPTASRGRPAPRTARGGKVPEFMDHCFASFRGLGMCKTLGLRPDQQVGQYSKHFDVVVDCKPEHGNFYQLSLGRRVRSQSIRRFDPIPVLPLHEALAAEFADQSEQLTTALLEAKREDRLPRIYTDHPWVTGSEDLIHPYCIYTDGVSFTRTDTVLGIFAYFSEVEIVTFWPLRGRACIVLADVLAGALWNR